MISRIQDIDTFGQDFQPGEVYIPSRPLVQQNEDVLNRVVQATQSPTVTTPTGKVVPAGVPLQVFGVVATESPSKQHDRTFSEVSVSFNLYVDDGSIAHVRVWFTGYKGNPNPVLMTDGQNSPITFLCETTGETVVVTVQSVGVDGTPSDLDTAPTAVVALDGVVSAPPAPSISQTLVGTNDGFQFAFNQVNVGSTQDVIDSYRIYRNTSNVFAGSTLIQTIKHSPTNTGAVVVTDTITAATGANYFYFVTAVNTQGLESASTSAQAGSVPGSTGSSPWSIVGTLTYSSTTTSITWSWTGLMIRRADGTTTNIPDSSQTVTGLTSSTTYFFYPFWAETTQTVAWVAGGAGTPAYAQAAATQALAQQQYLRNQIPLSTGGMSGSTSATGSGGGTGGGGGGGGCFSGNVKFKTPTGYMRFDKAPEEGWFRIENKTGVHMARLIIHNNWHEEMIDMGNGELVTFGHHIKVWDSEPFKPAIKVLPNDPTVDFTGTVYNLEVKTHDEESRHYVLENGIIAHNFKTF